MEKNCKTCKFDPCIRISCPNFEYWQLKEPHICETCALKGSGCVESDDECEGWQPKEQPVSEPMAEKILKYSIEELLLQFRGDSTNKAFDSSGVLLFYTDKFLSLFAGYKSPVEMEKEGWVKLADDQSLPLLPDLSDRHLPEFEAVQLARDAQMWLWNDKFRRVELKKKEE